jgi:uncharacterized membrane protein
MKHLATGLAGVLMLAACSQSAPKSQGAAGAESAEPAAAVPPASAPVLGGVDLSDDLKLSGTTPPWTLVIGESQIKLVRPGKPDVVAANGGPEMAPTAAIWNQSTPAGPFEITLMAQKCVGLSGVVQPLTALVTAGPDTLKGCAAPVAGQAAPTLADTKTPPPPTTGSVDVE